MPFPDHQRWAGRFHPEETRRLRISMTERLQHFVPAEQIEVDLPQRYFLIQLESGFECSSENCRRTSSRNASRNFGRFSSRKLTPAAISCPPNFSQPFRPHSPRARTIEQPSILRPLPFPAPLCVNT